MAGILMTNETTGPTIPRYPPSRRVLIHFARINLMAG